MQIVKGIVGIIILIAFGVFIWTTLFGFHNVPLDSGSGCTMYGDCY